jgi:hypothetical protein
LLGRKIGGPSVRPYQPAGLWEESGTGKSYVQDHGEKLYRRSLYTFWKRTLPPPNMLTFDATTREVCTAKRETTTTPLQALVLLNDPQFIEAARVLAEQLVRESGEHIETRLVKIFRLMTARQPAPQELAILRQLYQDQVRFFEQHTASAEQYVKAGEYPVDPALPVVPVAATTAVASTIMNLDEFVNQR